MNITELDSFNLADTVKFHDRLNHRLWDRSEHLQPEVHAKLMEIARDFQEFLGVPDLDVKDITVSGSNAAYNYTPNSDIDLHLVIDLPEADHSEVYRELFDAKKFQYNAQHNIKIGGYDVELYVQNPNEEHHSQGIYSLLRNAWVSVPRRRKAEIDDISTKSKYEDLAARINDTISSGDKDSMASLMKKIKAMRQAGLEKQGEFGADNLAFKLLRNNGYIKRLIDARNAARDEELSLAEKARPKQRITYGFVNESPDGVNPSTKMFLEEPGNEDEATVRDFINFVSQKLGITSMPEIVLHTDPEWSRQNKSFGRYTPETHTLEVNLANRHVMDTLRTTAHELVHCRQNQENMLPNEAGETGSKWENQANAMAGVIMRDYAEYNPKMFENASGYIPKNKKEAKDPRWAMATSVDVGPGQVGKEANKLGLQTGKNGEPGSLLNPAKRLAESLKQELALFEEDLFEVKMTSKNLANLAKGIEGVKVGLEFEMIVPNVTNDDGGDQEPDYDQDERVVDIDDAVNFFDDGDYNSRNEIRRLREQMESDYFDWQTEQIDQDWHNHGFEFFQEYLDREEPFDPEDYQERAEDEIKSEFPELDPTSEDFEELVAEKLREINAEYYVETWEAQGRSYDYAQEEFTDEKRDEYSESDWLDSLGIRYASDVQNEYSDVQWPYWTSSGDSETDIREVALNFMNYMGYDTIAVGDYHGYGGGYKKWVGNGWVSIGSSKPDDCFTVEPDGSLQADESSDTGLEFVSPPIPLDQIGETMKKVQQWAGENGVYTGKYNATSMHTNISIPGYDLDKLDYLKAALLLGDEHVLRQFDRIGNTYAKPAIEKVKQLVSAKPDKAKELLDKMKSQLNAEASKMIHSGQTDKYTSINTKDNRVEFRSPGGDYLSDIADNPQKMIDTINRMVVTLDAAMDPNKYKEEYQKKLYKVLTGQAGGREAKTGAKQEMKASDKDLLNIFSRYAAGELPKQALKSFVRQAQLERKVAQQKDKGVKMWWNVARDGQRMEVVATNEMDAKLIAAKEWGIVASDANLSSMTVKPLRPYDDTAGGSQVVAQQPTTPQWGVWDIQQGGFVNSRGGIGPAQGRLIGGDTYDAARNSARNNGLLDRLEGGEFEIRQIPQEQPTPSTTDAIRQAVGRNIAAQSAQTNQGNWGIWMQNADRFANQPGEYSRGATVPLYRFPSREAAEQWIAQQRAERPNMRTDIEVREIEPAEPIPGSTLDLQRQRAAQQGPTLNGRPSNPDGNFIIVQQGQTTPSYRFMATDGDDAQTVLDQWSQENPGSWHISRDTDQVFGQPSAPAQQSSVNNLTPRGPGPWEVASTSNNQVYYNTGHTQRAAAETEARTWIQQMGLDPAEFEVRTRESVRNRDAEQGGIVDVAGEQPTQAPQTLTRPGQGQQVFTGNWKVMIDGEEVYQFGGIGNSQADANRVGRDWILQQIRQGTLNPANGADVEVLPVMG